MGEFKGRLVQPPSTSKREIEPKNRMLEKLLAYLSVSTAASLALAACGIAEGSTNSQPQATEPVPLSSPTPDALNQLSNIELFNQFVTNQTETGHQFPTPTVFSSSEGTGLKPEQNQSIEQLLNTFVNLAQNQKVLNFSNDGLGVNTNSLGQIMIEDTLVFDFGNKGKAGMFLVSSEKGNKAYYLSNNGETATQLVFSIRYKDGSVEAFFDPKQVEAVLKETDPSLIESTNWNGIFMRPEVLGDNPADNFFATTREMQYEGEGTAFLFDVLSLDQQNLAMFDPGTLDMGFFKVETAAETEPTEEPTPAPIFGSKVLMSILVPTPTVEEVVPTAEPTPTPEPTQTPEQALEEFKESAEYKQGLQDYLDAMGLQEENVTITEEVKVINGQEYRFLEVTPKKNTLTADQQLFVHFYEPVPLFSFLEGDIKRIGIRDLSDPFNINFGNLILGRQKSNPIYSEIMKRDFGATLVDWHLQWIRTQPDRTGNIKLNDASSLFSFTNMLEQSSGKDYIKIGQPLVWEKPDFLPEYLFDLNEKELKEEIIHHVENLILAASDDVDVWTVVNEAETWPENRGKGYDWLFDKLGEQYIIEAFRTAYQTDPSKVLLYSDFANETISGIKYWQTTRVIELVQKEGIPISIGMHMRIDVQNPPTKDKLKEAFKDYGVDIYITELTLDLSKIPNSDSNRLLHQANVARTIMEAIIEYNLEAKQNGYPNSVKLVGFFGIQDSMNFLEEADGKSNADPTLFDDNLNPKPAYYAILETLYRLLDFNRFLNP